MLFAAALCVTVAGCKDSATGAAKHKVALFVAGAGDGKGNASITYTNESGASVTEQAHLPWRKEFTAGAGTKLSITVADTDGPSTVGDLVIPTKVSCQIIVDDSMANSSGLQADRASCDYTVA